MKNQIEILHKKFAKFAYIMYNIYKEDRRGDPRDQRSSESLKKEDSLYGKTDF